MGVWDPRHLFWGRSQPPPRPPRLAQAAARTWLILESLVHLPLSPLPSRGSTFIVLLFETGSPQRLCQVKADNPSGCFSELISQNELLAVLRQE